MRYSKLRKGVRSTPRKVRSRGKVYYKKILVNSFKFFIGVPHICSQRLLPLQSGQDSAFSVNF